MYVLVAPDEDAHAHAYLSLFAGARGMGADVIGDVKVLIDLRHGTATVATELPAEYAEPAKALAAKLLAVVRNARAERRRGIRRPTTAHERWLAAGGK